MFDIGWSELLIIGALLLVVVGPKELPKLMRTVGKYAGVLRRQANEFRNYFDEAMREAELDEIKKDMTDLRNDVTSSVREATQDFENEFEDAKRELDAAAKSSDEIDVDKHNAEVLAKEARDEAVDAVSGGPASEVAAKADDAPAGAKGGV